MTEEERSARMELAKNRASGVLGDNPEVFESPLTVLASPAWRGIEGDVWRAGTQGKSIVLKHYHPDTEFYVDPRAAITAATQAGKIGVGPAVAESWPDEGIVAFTDLSTPWRAGGLQDVVSAKLRSNVIAHKKTFQSEAKLDAEASIFNEIENLYAIAQTNSVPTHNDVAVFLEFFRDAKARLASLGQDSLPCHRDGNTANLMVGPEDAVQLLDFDLAANCDPFEDVGCYLVEFFESDGEARPGFEEWYGSFDEGLFQRSMIYGLADDMRWGLIGSIMAAQSPRSYLEFSKYAAWRFMRLEMHAKRSEASDRVRLAA